MCACRPRRAAAGIAIAVAATAAGCGGEARPQPPEDPVVLISAGAEPQRVLAYQPLSHPRSPRIIVDEPGVVMTLRWELTGAEPTLAYRFELAAVKFDLDEARSQGEARARLEASNREVEHAMLELEPGVAVADRQGRAAAKILGKHFTSPSIPSVLTTVIIPFPAEPVGLGARWRVQRTAAEGDGATLVTDYELAGLVPDSASIRAHGKIEQHGKEVGDFDVIATVRFDDLLPHRADVTLRIHDDAAPAAIQTLRVTD